MIVLLFFLSSASAQLFTSSLCPPADPSLLCSPPISACVHSLTITQNERQCLRNCANHPRCSGFSFHSSNRSCLLSIGYCVNSAIRKVKAFGPQKCSDITAYTSGLPNAEYQLFLPSKPWKGVKVYCHRMNTPTPKAYITLPHLNYVHYTGSFDNNPLHVLSNRTFAKIAVDEQTLIVGVNDFTFEDYVSTPNNYPYGRPGGCKGRGNLGKMLIDLRGTAFHVHPQVSWRPIGHHPLSTALLASADRKVLKIACGGLCGHCIPVYTEAQNVHENKLILSID